MAVSLPSGPSVQMPPLSERVKTRFVFKRPEHSCRKNGDRWERQRLYPWQDAGVGLGCPCSQCCPRESGVGVRTKATEEAELARTMQRLGRPLAL